MDQDNAATLEAGPDARAAPRPRQPPGRPDALAARPGPHRLRRAGPRRARGRAAPTAASRVSLTHAGGVRSRVSASKINHLEDRELRAYGSAGSYVAHGTDVQAQAVFAGRRPVDEGDAWGYDAPEHWGTLHTAAGSGAGAVRTGRLPGLLHPVRRRAARRRRLPGARRAGRAHPRGAGRRPDQRGREPRGRPVAGVDGHELCGLIPG